MYLKRRRPPLSSQNPRQARVSTTGSKSSSQQAADSKCHNKLWNCNYRDQDLTFSLSPWCLLRAASRSVGSFSWRNQILFNQISSCLPAALAAEEIDTHDMLLPCLAIRRRGRTLPFSHDPQRTSFYTQLNQQHHNNNNNTINDGHMQRELRSSCLLLLR